MQGGTSAGKSIAILLLLIQAAQTDESPTLTSIVSESFPHLKRGVMRDFLTIMQAHEYFDPDAWNMTDFIYTFPTGSKIEFFSADQPSKVRGPRRDRLFINEANNVPFEAFDQLEVRTRDYIFMDWNPVNAFWYHEHIQGKRDDYEFVIVTYLDNEGLDARIVASIEQRRENKNWFQVYGLGQLGFSEAQIFKDWEIIEKVPQEARLERYGLDFGYTNDPSALIAVYRYNGGFLFDERVYEKGLPNRVIADKIIQQPERALVIADSAEPKSIDEIRGYGVNITGCRKGPGSVSQRIQFLQDQKVYVTKQSTNLIRDYRNYLWKSDRDGKILNEPEHAFSHGPDACMYALDDYRERPEAVVKRRATNPYIRR